jgi:acyl-CoA reductase-like NAD-dependent aldehyde dehydrogenase
MFMAKLAQDAGFPDGSVNIIHGSADSALCPF